MIKCKVCGKRALYGYKRGDKNKFCKIHKEIGMIDLNSKNCNYSGCKKKPNYNTPGKKAGLFCSEHKTEFMVDVRSPRCKYENCNKQPSFNTPGKKSGIFCTQHKTEFMVNTISKICNYSGCNKQPSFNTLGEKTGKFCSEHKTEFMVSVKSRNCNYTGCNKQPNFNISGEKIGKFCSEHKTELMVNVNSNIKCKYENCNKIASFNTPDEKTGAFCVEHKTEFMVDLRSRKCKYENCNKQASFNTPGKKSGIFCTQHKTEFMVDVRSKICDHEDCRKHVCYGYVGNSVTRCAEHKLQGMYRRPKRKCEKCCETATYGIKSPEHCEEHKVDKEICLLVRECSGCHRKELILDDTGLCILYCKPTKIYNEVKREKVKETKVLAYLDNHLDVDDVKYEDDKIIDGGACNKKRPDRVYDCGTHFVIVEVDENQHKGYTKENNCELVRMHQIYESLGMHCVFLRFNPDKFKVDGKLVKKMNMSERLDLLTKWVKKCIETPPTSEFERVKYKFLYYDDFNTSDTSFNILDDLLLINQRT
jgi:hypothetical protein